MKLKEEKINKEDLKEYTENYSDFSFEMKVLNCFPDSFKVNHGGTYEDPVSGKFREFDIRAEYLFKRAFPHGIYMAVEAKNIKSNFPLLISCVPRKEMEAYHDIIVSKYKEDQVPGFPKYGLIKTIRHTNNRLYPINKFVGKSLDQIGRRDTGSFELINNDSDIYSKWSQAVNSSFELAEQAFFKSMINRISLFISFIMPIVVIPDKMLWIAKYDKEGNRIGEITQKDEFQYYIGNKFVLGDKISNEEFVLTHLHIMTFSKFKKFVNKIDRHIDTIFPESERYF